MCKRSVRAVPITISRNAQRITARVPISRGCRRTKLLVGTVVLKRPQGSNEMGIVTMIQYLEVAYFRFRVIELIR